MTAESPGPRNEADGALWAEMEGHHRRLHETLDLLGAAAASVKLPVSPQMAAGVQATENAWRRMEQKFGLITGAQVASLSGSSQRRGGFASYRRKAGKLLGIKRGNAYVYPGFQFDGNGRVLDSVIAAISVARELGVSEDSLAQWFCLRSDTLGDCRPVDVIGDPAQVVSALRQRFGVQW